MAKTNHKTVESEAEKRKKFGLNKTEIEESDRLRKLFSVMGFDTIQTRKFSETENEDCSL